MKKLLCGMLAVCILSLTMPAKKAEAGFMILAGTQEFVWKHKYETLDTVLVIALPVMMVTTGLFAVGIAGLPINNGTLIAGAILLDETVEQKRDDIKAALLARHTYLDDMGVLENLADAIIPRYAGAKDADGNAMITIPEAELMSAVEGLDLSSEQTEDLISSLAK
jgi:hypothetical protein